MHEIAQIRRLSIWIFFIPLIAINFCLIISQNYYLLENTIFIVDQIGRSGFSIPYLDGSLSISRASRTFPQYLIFKPAMFLPYKALFSETLPESRSRRDASFGTGPGPLRGAGSFANRREPAETGGDPVD